MNEIKIASELVEKGLIFFDPRLKTFIPRDEYLSGNVRQKLTDSREAIADPDLDRELKALLPKNIEELDAVQPMAVLPPAAPPIKKAVLASLGVELDSMTPDKQAQQM